MQGKILFGLICLCLLGGCTERRRATEPVPDGDTIEVVIPQSRQEIPKQVPVIDAEKHNQTEETPGGSE